MAVGLAESANMHRIDTGPSGARVSGTCSFIEYDKHLTRGGWMCVRLFALELNDILDSFRHKHRHETPAIIDYKREYLYIL